MKKAILYIFIIFVFASCIDIGDNYDLKVDTGKDVHFNDPSLQPLFIALEKVNRDSIGFSPLDSNARIIYKEEFEGTLIKLFFEKPDFLRIIYFKRLNNKITYSSESEETKGPRKLSVLNVDGYKSEIQETISIFYDSDKENLADKNLKVEYLDIEKYLSKNPNNDPAIFIPQYEYDTEITIEQAKEIISSWKLGK